MSQHQTTVTLPLGHPIYAHALYYTAMFSAKPFREALLVYRQGGTYTILSPGEDHHGCWVSATAPLDPPRHVSFMSWPSADWNHDIAAHTLTFAPDTGAFTQELRLPGEPVPRAQHGFAVAVPSPETIDPSAGWAALREQHRATFDELHVLAGVRRPSPADPVSPTASDS